MGQIPGSRGARIQRHAVKLRWFRASSRASAIARGNGRAYGDSAISVTNTIHMRHFNRMLGFDDKTGTLIAEAGVLLADIIAVFLRTRLVSGSYARHQIRNAGRHDCC